jgi:hypothetical protein
MTGGQMGSVVVRLGATGSVARWQNDERSSAVLHVPGREHIGNRLLAGLGGFAPQFGRGSGKAWSVSGVAAELG